jgi:hypothetical protein
MENVGGFLKRLEVRDSEMKKIIIYFAFRSVCTTFAFTIT